MVPLMRFHENAKVEAVVVVIGQAVVHLLDRAYLL